MGKPLSKAELELRTKLLRAALSKDTAEEKAINSQLNDAERERVEAMVTAKKLIEAQLAFMPEVSHLEDKIPHLVSQAFTDVFMTFKAGQSSIDETVNRCLSWIKLRPTKPELYVGAMSGTSMDGIDVTILETDGEDVEQKTHHYLAYTDGFKVKLRQVETAIRNNDGNVAAAKREFGIQKVIDEQSELHALAINQLLEKSGFDKTQIKAIGVHGQTFFHDPKNRVTVQLTNPELIAMQTGIQVVSNFRARDVSLGGQGAPFAPVYHLALLNQANLVPAVVINCGGISNATIVRDNELDNLTGFDCGPGNVLLDQWVKAKTANKEHMDTDGKYAAAGSINTEMLEKLRTESCDIDGYFDKAPPKSLCTSNFKLPKGFDKLSLEDGCATLAAFTAQMIVESLKGLLTKAPKTWVLAGGGWKNPAIKRNLTGLLVDRYGSAIKVKSAEDVGFVGDGIEADIFAYCAARLGLALPITAPNTTGVPWPCTGGEVTQVPSHTHKLEQKPAAGGAGAGTASTTTAASMAFGIGAARTKKSERKMVPGAGLEPARP